ncbi:MAG: glycosyltransferase family 4 protein [Candidatus Omnitrophica bacterium]|nr:glycosyltransferase family 4 protein [Candidatus Omnitrophota bacterium]MDD5552867.1 glycosyltransferase family 4 protein [Candidatus Omnitrophota bacterium]
MKYIEGKKQVCVITSSFPRSSHDYAGVFIYELLEALCKHGFSFKVVAPRANDRGHIPVEQGANDGIEVNRIGFFFFRKWESLCYGDGMLNNFQSSVLAKAQLVFYMFSAYIYSAVTLRKCDIIWSHWCFPSGLIGALLRRFCGKKHILSLHSGWAFLLKKGIIGRQIARFIINNSDLITAVSSCIKEETLQVYPGSLRRKLSERISILPMGISLDRFEDLRKTPKFTLRSKYGISSEKTILYLGRLISTKGLKCLFSAAAGYTDTTLMIAGGGGQEEELRRLAKGLSCDVRFLGLVSGRKKMELLRLADAVVVPSVGSRDGQAEGMPVVILEAMASGTPVIASDIGGISEVIRDNFNGFLVKRNDIPAMREKIELLFCNRSRYDFIAENSLKGSERFELERLSREYKPLFDLISHG